MRSANVAIDFKSKLTDMSDSRKLLAINIQRLSSRPGYSKAGLASFLDVSRSHISHYVSGQSFPGTEYLDKIAEYFNVPVSELFVESTQKSEKKEPSLDEAIKVVTRELGYRVEKVGKK